MKMITRTNCNERKSRSGFVWSMSLAWSFNPGGYNGYFVSEYSLHKQFSKTYSDEQRSLIGVCSRDIWGNQI